MIHPSHNLGPAAPTAHPGRTIRTCIGCKLTEEHRDAAHYGIECTAPDLALERPCGQPEPDTALTMTADTLRLTGLATKPFGYVPPGRYSWLAMEGWDGVRRVLLVSAGAVTTTPVGEIGAYDELGSGTRVRPRRGAGGHTTG